MINGLHSKTWFEYGDCAEAEYTTLGGRQGCKFGSIVFNAVNAVATTRMRKRLEDAGILVKST